MTTITPEQLDELERKAKAATEGPWFLWTGDEDSGDGRVFGDVSTRNGSGHIVIDGEFDTSADREYVAAAHPATTLALIARIRELEAELDATEDTTKAVAKLAGAEVRIAELEGAVAAERERCAKIVEEPWEANSWVESDSEYLARRIRAG